MRNLRPLIILLAAALMMAAPGRVSAKSDKVSYNITRAIEEAQKGNVATAIEYIDRELKDNPKNGEAFLLKGQLLMGEEEYGPAASAIEKAIRFIPGKKKDMRSIAFATRAQLRVLDADTIGAYADLDEAIRLDPTDEDYYSDKGQLLFEQNRYDESDAVYAKLHTIDPGGVMGRMGQGRNANARGDYDAAIKLFTSVIDQNPEYSNGYSFRAESYLGKESYLQAASDIARALEIDSDRKAHILMFTFPKEKLPLMIAKLKSLSVKEPYSGEYDYYAGQLYNYCQMYSEAAKMLRQAYSKDARDIFLEPLAQAYMKMGAYDAALYTINRAIQMDEDDQSYVNLRAQIYLNMGNADKALEDFNTLVENNPDNSNVYYNRGMAEYNSGRDAEALADFEMAEMLGDNDFQLLGVKADMLASRGRNAEAKAVYQSIIDRDTVPDGDSSWAMFALGALGRAEEAWQFMDRILEADTLNSGYVYNAACLASRTGDTARALSLLDKAMSMGYRNLSLLQNDRDLRALRELPQFDELVKQYYPPVTIVNPIDEGDGIDEVVVDVIPDTAMNEVQLPAIVEVPITPKGGVYEVECTVNSLPLKFIFDTGASDVSLSQVEANFMLKNGYIKPSDFLGTQYMVDATGSISEGTVINLREIDFAGISLNNVKASVVKNQRAPLLLGQTVLGRLGKIEIDNSAKKLIIRR